MNRRSLVLSVSALGVAAFAGGSWLVRDRQAREAAAEADARTAAIPDPNALLVRPTAPVLGPEDAPVTLVEFFDPSCEACRAFHPVLKQLRAEFPDSLRIVMRYAAFHQGSDEAVAILEAARRQNMFEPVLNAVLESQPAWARHDRPNLDIAWDAAEAAGLNISTRDIETKYPATVAILTQDRADIEALGVRATPTFYLDGLQLTNVSLKSLADSVLQAVTEAT